MAGLPKKYFKMYPGNLKAGWAAFKKSKGKSTKKAVKAQRKIIVHKKRKEAVVMAKRRVRHHARRAASAVRHHAKKSYHRAKALASSKPAAIAIQTAEGVAGAVVSAFIVKQINTIAFAKTPMKPSTSAIAQGVIGVATFMFVRNKHAKAMGAGAAFASVLSLLKSQKIEALAGDAQSRTLSHSELQSLISNLGIPAQQQFLRGMGLPAPVMRGVMPSEDKRPFTASAGWSQGW